MAVGKNKASLKISVCVLEYGTIFLLKVHIDSQMFLQKEVANTSTTKLTNSVYFQVQTYRRFRSFGM